MLYLQRNKPDNDLPFGAFEIICCTAIRMSKYNCNFALQRGFFKRSPFALQKESFYTPKGVLLHTKRGPFARQKDYI